MKQTVSIIGAGSWGTTLAITLAKKNINIQLHSVFSKHNSQMRKERCNNLFLKGVRFPKTLKINSSLSDTLSSNIIIIAIPVKYLRKSLKGIKALGLNLSRKTFVSVAKGIEVWSLKRVSQIVTEELGEVKFAVLSGPNIAKEVLKGIPSTSIIACKQKKTAQNLQQIFFTTTFRVYYHHDIIGVELGGALKNIIAIACGISDGLGYGTNTKSALVSRGLVEIIRLGKKMGANPKTFWGISGLGDLVTTCFSSHSRNRFVGEQVGKGKNIATVIKNMAQVAEGVETVKSAYQLSKKLNIDMPITAQIYAVLYKNKLPKRAVSDLMTRPLKGEQIG